jgi:hypothetical protein
VTNSKTKSSYSEKLKDPRWQKKRLEVLKRDEWACRGCGDNDTTLHVHHIFYIPRSEPWDIPDGLLITLCESCHHPSCDFGPCESCEYFKDNCEGLGSIPEDLIVYVGNILNDIWNKKGDFLDVLHKTHKLLRGE